MTLEDVYRCCAVPSRHAAALLLGDDPPAEGLTVVRYVHGCYVFPDGTAIAMPSLVRGAALSVDVSDPFFWW